MTSMSDLYADQKLARKVAQLRDWKVEYFHDLDSIGKTASGLPLPAPGDTARGVYVVRHNRRMGVSRRREWVAVALFTGPSGAADANRYVASKAGVVV